MNSQTTFEPSGKLINESKIDLISDFHEIVYLLEKPKTHLSPVEKNDYAKKVSRRIEALKAIASKQINLLSNKKELSPDSILSSITIKNQAQKELRSIIKSASFIAWEEEWQSPSFTDQNPQMRGMLTGKIEHTINDYKRDRHNLAKDYEAKFIKAYYKSGFFTSLSALATNSGMSAFTLILMYLLRDGVEEFFLGRHSYFEIKVLLKEIGKKRYRI